MGARVHQLREGFIQTRLSHAFVFMQMTRHDNHRLKERQFRGQSFAFVLHGVTGQLTEIIDGTDQLSQLHELLVENLLQEGVFADLNQIDE